MNKEELAFLREQYKCVVKYSNSLVMRYVNEQGGIDPIKVPQLTHMLAHSFTQSTYRTLQNMGINNIGHLRNLIEINKEIRAIIEKEQK